MFWKDMAAHRVALSALAALAVAVTAAPVGGSSAAAATAGAAESVSVLSPEAATVRLTHCSRPSTRGIRRAIFRASMDSVPGTARMSMRFVLLEQVGRGPRRRVRAPELAGWRHSRTGVARFTYRQRVLPLEPGVIYRMIVRFRWHDADGTVIGSVRRRSRRCSQGRPLPNLAVTERIAGAPGPSADTTRYRVTVVNTGRARANGVELALLVDGAEADRRAIGGLAPGQRLRVWFLGPACATNVEAKADPGGLVRESSERDNARLFGCPTVG